MTNSCEKCGTKVGPQFIPTSAYIYRKFPVLCGPCFDTTKVEERVAILVARELENA